MIERVILSAGAMLIFSVSFQIDQMPEGNETAGYLVYIAKRIRQNLGKESFVPWLTDRQTGEGRDDTVVVIIYVLMMGLRS